MLSLNIFLPLLLAFGGIFINNSSARACSIFASAISLLLLIVCALADCNQFGLTLIKAFNFGFNLNASSISFALAIVACFMVFASSIFFSFKKAEYVCSMLLIACMNGLFFADDALLFYIFWEASLFPLLYLMALYNQTAIAKRFFIFAFFGSIFMLVAIIYLAANAATNGAWLNFDISAFDLEGLSASSKNWLFFAFVLAFAIKAPIFPLHSWAIKTYSKAPNFVSVMLASFKMAPFGFIKFMPLFSEQFEQFGGVLAGICAASAVYSAILAISAKDYKELCAMSSISHLGIICAGIFTSKELAISGAVFYMIAHALISGSMFFYAQIFKERYGTYELASLSHLSRKLPYLSFIFAVLLFSSISLPFTINFVGEFLVLSQLFASFKAVGVVATLVVIFGSVYMLVFFRRCFLSPKIIECAKERILLRHSLMLSLIALIAVLLGIMPHSLLEYLAI